MIFVPTRIPSSVATRAMLIEGFEVTEMVMEDPYHYSRALEEVWNEGREFVVVEDDVVPWPGAIKAILDCSADWCAYEHPRTYVQYEPRSGFAVGLGCNKFTANLVERCTPNWREVRWDEVTLLIDEALVNETCHMHYPPVAHVKSSRTLMKRV